MSAKDGQDAEQRFPCPEDLGDAGALLWVQIVDSIAENWALDNRELHLLTEACLVADQVAALDAAVAEDGHSVKGSRGQPTAHPALAEARQLRALQLRLLGSLELSDPIEAVSGSATPDQARKRRAASAKWARERRKLRA